MTETIEYRTVGTWSLHSDKPYKNPFLDVAMDAVFHSPSGRAFTVPGFYDGERTWRVFERLIRVDRAPGLTFVEVTPLFSATHRSAGDARSGLRRWQVAKGLLGY